MVDWLCGAARNLPVDRDAGWDSDAAADSIFELAGFNSGSPDPAKARRGFLAYDPQNGESKDGYRLPFAVATGGSLTAVSSGLRNAASRLAHSELPDSAIADARDVLDGFFGEIDEGGDADDGRSQIMLTRMDIRKATNTYDPTGPLPEGIARQLWDPSVLDDGPPFYFTVAASTGQIDTYSTRMLPSSLRNFAADAAEGISLCNSHNTDELPFGRTYDGRFVPGGKTGTAGSRAEMDVFMARGLMVNGIDTNQVISGIRWGTARDVSVGFYGGTMRCSMCGKDMGGDLFSLLFFGFPDGEEANDPDAPCWHIPGMDFPVLDKKGQKTGEMATAIGEIDGAHCAEVSLVFKGATPGAAVINGRRCAAIAKAERMAHIGVLGRNTATSLLSQYRNVRSAAIEDVVRRRYSGALLRAESISHQPLITELLAEANARAEDAVPTATQVVEPAVEETAAAAAADNTPTPDADTQRAATSTDHEEAPVMTMPTTTGADTTTAQEQPPEQRSATAEPTPPPPALDPPVAEQSAQADSGATQSAPASPPAGDTPVSDRAVAIDTRAPAPQQDTREAASLQARRTALDEVRLALVGAHILPEDFTGDPVQGIREFGPEVDRLRGWATVGQSARAELVQRIREEGVRALGPDRLPPEVYDPVLSSGSWSQLIGLRDHLSKQAATRFPSGRATQETQDTAPETAADTPKPGPQYTPSVEPDSVYQVRL